MPNLGQYHEIMDRASVVLELFVSQIEETECTRQDPQLKERAEELRDRLHDFYQLAAERHTEMEKECDGDAPEKARELILERACERAMHVLLPLPTTLDEMLTYPARVAKAILDGG